MTYEIQVAQEDIDHGQKMDCNLCPVATAMARAGIKDCAVYTYSCRVGLKFFDFPIQVPNWICSFDAGSPVKPFTFQLEVK